MSLHCLFPIRKSAAAASLFWMVATAPSPALGAAQTAPALVQAFKDRLTNVRAWLHKDGQSLLDMDVVVVGNGKTPVRTLDGKPQLTAGSDGTLRLAMPSAYRAIALPVYKGDGSLNSARNGCTTALPCCWRKRCATRSRWWTPTQAARCL